jgi:hypothetical protein
MKRLFLLAILLGATCGSTSAQCYSSDGTKCCGVTSIDACPVEGCGGDANLNRRKNVTDIPITAAVEDHTFNWMLYLLFPASWQRGADRAMLTDWGEGKAVRLKVRIIKAKSSGHETPNCHLKLQANNDFHLVFTRIKGETEEHSITGEMTPRLRPEGWTLSKLRDLADEEAYVRVTGYLMLDTEHLGDSVPKRYTHWEIHPITAFEVCTMTKAKCDQGEGWVSLESLSP